MNQSVDRFQEWADGYMDDEVEEPMVDLSNIDRVPLAFFICTEDETCTYKHATEYMPNFGVDLSVNIIQGGSHHFYRNPVPDSFVQALMNELQ
jgi:surfactin synthase thioesterase subunit